MTISGLITANVQKAPTDAKESISRGDSKIVIAVKEDLGGGMSIDGSFDLLSNARASTNSASSENFGMNLTGGFGKLSLAQNNAGNQRVSGGESLPNYLSDAWGGDTTHVVVSYTLPEFVQGLTLSVDNESYDASYGTGTITSLPVVDLFSGSSSNTPKTATHYKVSYAFGAANVGMQYRNTDKRKVFTGSYDFGVAKVSAAMDSTPGSTNSRREIALTAPMGAVQLGVHYGSKQGDAKGYAVSAKYSLSKRTAVIASFGHIQDDATYNGNQNRIQLAHSF